PRPMRQGSRGRDRRCGWADFLAFLAGGLHAGRDPRALRTRFEEGLRRLLPARVLTLREVEPTIPRLRGATSESMTLDVPGSPERPPFALETVFDPGCGLDEWDVQVLEAARYIAALVLEIERLALGPGWLGGGRGDTVHALVGSSDPIRELRDRISRVAATDFTVLVEGESGAGKELVARQLHEQSRRRRGPFVAVNCAALVETLLEAELFGIEERTATGVRGRRGKFEHADGGTLFLDEVSDLSLSAQAKLLRVLQDLAVERVGGSGPRRVDVRVVVATNRGLSLLVETGRFRVDLYYRLNGVEVHVPPLRARRGDIPELAEHFLYRYRAVRRLRITPSAMDALLTYEWPGNVRELERVIERAIALGSDDEIGLDDLPPVVAGEYVDVLAPSAARGETLREWARRYVRLVLDRHDNNRRRASAALGISFHTLRAYMREMREVAEAYGGSQADGGGGRTGSPPERRDIAGEPDGRGVAAHEEP
ncbi:MAG: sigma 54-interacting transcriptional regulator, partial [Vicinamibacterales bacterium]